MTITHLQWNFLPLLHTHLPDTIFTTIKQGNSTSASYWFSPYKTHAHISDNFIIDAKRSPL